MKKKLAKLLVVCSFLLIWVSVAKATTLAIDHGPGFFGWATFSDDTDYHTYTSFILTEETLVKGINWWGQSKTNYGTSDNPSIQDFQITIYESAHSGFGWLGDIFYQEVMGPDQHNPNQITPISDWTMYYHSADFNTTFSLLQDTTYFLSIRSQGSGYYWGWNMANYSGPTFQKTQSASYWDGYSTAYQLEAGNPVPEPVTMLLLGFGLIGLAGVSKKKKIGTE